MTTATPELDLHDVAKLCEKIPSLPTAAGKFVQICKDPEAEINDLADAVSLDPALASKILRLANSAAYSRGREVTSLQRACMVLGIKTLKVIALSFSLRTHIESTAGETLDLIAFWRRSLVTSVAARALARLIKCPQAEEAFFCGLVSQIGQFAIARALPEDFARVAASSRASLPTSDEYRVSLPIDHHRIGKALLEAWDMPTLFSAVTGRWGKPEEGDDETVANVAKIVHIADAVSEIVCENDKSNSCSRLYSQAETLFGLAEQEVYGFVVSIEQSIAEMSEILDVSYDGKLDLQALLDEAREQVIKISLDTAMDLAGAHDREQELEREATTLREAAQNDALTGLPNRGEFDVRLASTIDARLKGKNENSYGLIMIDIDHFKQFNDTYGHAAGDDVLKSVAGWLRGAMRSTDFVARYGGEEFVVVVPNATGEEMAMIGERIRSRIADSTVEINGEPMQVTASVGVAYVKKIESRDCGTALLKVADQCLYKAKEGGRNRVVCTEVKPF